MRNFTCARCNLLFVVLFFTACNNLGRNAVNDRESQRLLLIPDPGTMHCNVVMNSGGERQIFALTIPETIACRDSLLLNFPETNIKWQGPDDSGVVRTSWTKEKVIAYELELIPFNDYVDVNMSVTNLSDSRWEEVWSFNCLNPVKAPLYQDTLMTRTYMATKEGPVRLADTERVIGRRPTIGVYFQEAIDQSESYAFVRDFRATSPQLTSGDYLVTLSKTGDAYMAATSPNALFLFNNLQFKCIHSAPNFGNIPAGASKTMTCRFYFARGGLDGFLERYNNKVGE